MREKYVQAFKLLNLEPQADKDVVRRAYKKRIQQLHPDRDVENTTPERKQEELARLEADKQREQHAQTDNPSQDDAPRPVTANPELRRHMATAWQKSTSPTRQWDPTYHENRVRGINPDNT